MTLSDFLLARIAEDEERARFVDSQQDEWAKRQIFEPWRLSWHDEYDLLCIEPSRAIAECEAKRRIVEDYAHLVERGQPGPLLAHAEFVARLLALPFASHPDYRAEEWAP